MGLEVKSPGETLSREQRVPSPVGTGGAGSMPWSGRWRKEQRCWKKSGEWSRQAKPSSSWKRRQRHELRGTNQRRGQHRRAAWRHCPDAVEPNSRMTDISPSVRLDHSPPCFPRSGLSGRSWRPPRASAIWFARCAAVMVSRSSPAICAYEDPLVPDIIADIRAIDSLRGFKSVVTDLPTTNRPSSAAISSGSAPATAAASLCCSPAVNG